LKLTLAALLMLTAGFVIFDRLKRKFYEYL
jgi:hypothetical protein